MKPALRSFALTLLAVMAALATARGAEAPPAASNPPAQATPAAQPCVFDLPLLKTLQGVSQGVVLELFAKGEYEKERADAKSGAGSRSDATSKSARSKERA